jgi:hypothetical protein
MRSNLPTVAEKSMTMREPAIVSSSPVSSCHRVLVSDLNLRVLIAVRRCEMCFRSMIIAAMLVISRAVGETRDGKPKTNRRLAKNKWQSEFISSPIQFVMNLRKA